MSWTTLCELDELKEDEGKYVEIGGFRLAVFRQGDVAYALDSRCPHVGANLADGAVRDGCVTCPRHNWVFHLNSGQLWDTPGVMVDTYKTRVLKREGVGAMVQADLPMV